MKNQKNEDWNNLMNQKIIEYSILKKNSVLTILI